MTETVLARCPNCGYEALTTPQAAALLGVTRQTILNWLAEGRFPNRIVDDGFPGGRTLIPVADVDAELEKRRTA